MTQHFANSNLSDFLPHATTSFACVDSRSESDILVSMRGCPGGAQRGG